VSQDSCAVCIGGTTNLTACIQDCNDVCGGLAVEDCANVCDGSAVVDECGVCGEDNFVLGTLCPYIDLNGYGSCEMVLGYAFTGQECELISGCGTGDDGDYFTDSYSECTGNCYWMDEANSDCVFDCQNCKILDADGYGYCEMVLGWVWTGESCEQISGCGAGDDAPWFYEDEEICNCRCSYGFLSYETVELPQEFTLSSYPNPFNPITTISFSIPKFGFTTITTYDITGRELEILTNTNLNPGNYSIDWNASSYPSGVYLIRMDSGDFTQTQKVVLVK